MILYFRNLSDSGNFPPILEPLSERFDIQMMDSPLEFVMVKTLISSCVSI